MIKELNPVIVRYEDVHSPETRLGEANLNSLNMPKDKSYELKFLIEIGKKKGEDGEEFIVYNENYVGKCSKKAALHFIKTRIRENNRKLAEIGLSTHDSYITPRDFEVSSIGRAA